MVDTKKLAYNIRAMEKSHRLSLCIIYKLINKINGKMYIGQTWYELSIRSNAGNGYKGCTLLWNAIKKYGWQNFRYEFITFCGTQEISNYLENFFIEKYKSNNRKYGYNLRNGGSHGKHSEETKEKMSLAKKGKPSPKKGKLGKIPSLETRQKLAIALKGNKNSLGKKTTETTKKKLSIAMKGKKNRLGVKSSEETKQKISKSLIGNMRSLGLKHSDETKKKLSNMRKGSNHPNFGKSPSNETRKKMADAKIGKPSTNKGKTWSLIDGKRVWADK